MWLALAADSIKNLLLIKMSRVSAVVEHLTKLSLENRDKHRATFLHFMGAMVGNDVNAECSDGRSFKAIYHTGTPFPRSEFAVVLKVARPMVRTELVGRTIIKESHHQPTLL